MALMTPEQDIAFDSANQGLPFTADAVGVLVVSVGIVLMLTWCSWVAVSSYKGLSNPGASVPDAAGKVVRAVFVVMVAIAIMAV